MATKEIIEKKILSVDTHKMSNVLKNLGIFADYLNSKFIPLCSKFGIVFTTQFLNSLMTDRQAIQKLFDKQVNSEVLAMGTSGSLIRESLIESAKPIISQLKKELAILQSYDDQLSHANYMIAMRGISIYPKIEIVSNRAIISETAKQEIVKMFTHSIETGRQQMAYDILLKVADGMNKINEMNQDSPELMPEFLADEAYLQMGKDGQIEVIPSIINYF